MEIEERGRNPDEDGLTEDDLEDDLELD